MNKRYELVVVIDPVLTADQMSALKAKIVETIGNVLDTDDMGLLPLAYPVNGQQQAYFVSWYLDLDPAQVAAYSHELRITRGIQKFFFYSLGQQKFLKFAEVTKAYEAIKEKDEEASAAAAEIAARA